jgi:cytochrome oxidase assembly protein ShyY1
MLGITLFLGTACFTVYLGVWQVKRRAWKTALISRREKALEAEPMELQEYLKTRPNVAVVDRSASIDAASEVLEAANDLRRVTTRGRLLYDKTLLLGPRNPPSTDNSSTAGQGSGFYLVTPLRLHDGRLILVNRGWCSLENLASASRETRDLSEVVEVVGVVRKGEQQPQFLEEYDPVQTGSWIWLDLPRMARVAGILDGKDGGATHASNFPSSSQAEPILVDALEIAGNRNKNMKRRSLGEYVIFTTTPMIHTVYATTWFTLSAALVALTYVRFKKKMPMPNRATQAALSNRK